MSAYYYLFKLEAFVLIAVIDVLKTLHLAIVGHASLEAVGHLATTEKERNDFRKDKKPLSSPCGATEIQIIHFI